MSAPSKNVFVKGHESPDEGGFHPTNVSLRVARRPGRLADRSARSGRQKQNRPAEQGGSKFLVKGSSSTFGFKGLDQRFSGLGWF